ncbi:phage/plasmid primase, P4 family, C-terminal domain [Actinomyces bovis]|uniref:Phage/plasmid primase, P4 family, C-terminal domain n=1 Tax=Actinomyces bovis TaxID=1658 RepID=A0ABY1VNX8_9ACTO|nr:phage/plasmid primase, P4 family [Actinomyces bovis]SPT53819.1 phage/plasmid primase, P4 family, C-terminal domain [Actinomyces bovis]VEG53182.1 phage/plasmid primase, P4 family, C-terminal domain [Actinomyces israelii]
MSCIKKDSSRAMPAKGTASSIYVNNNTISPVYQAPDASTDADWRMGRGCPSGNQGDVYNPAYLYGGENYHKALHDAVTCALRARAGKSLSELSEDVVKTTNDLIKWVRMNEAPDNPEPGKRYGRSIRNWALVKSIDPVQAAELVFACERIRMVCTRETIEKETSEGVFAMYGWSEGIYHEIGDGQIDAWCHEIAGAVNGNWKKNFVQKLHDMASRRENRVCECDDPDLVFMANGIWDYRNGLLLDFDPEFVALRKSDTAIPATEPPVPTHTMPDGTVIDFWQLLDSYVPYEGGRDLLVKVAGAALRSYHNWRVMVTVYNKTGHNGKSTFLDHLKALVGYDGCMTSSLALLAGGGDGGRFGVSNIVGVSLITCEDSDTGAYLKDNSRLKSIISHDAIGVERKNKGVFDYTPHALIVCAANDIPKTRDKGDAWLDRNIYVPFTGQFIGKADDKTIRSEWVVSREFCEYMAYQSLVKWDKYYELPEPEEAVQLKREWVLGNDTVAEFWEDIKDAIPSDFVPNDYLSMCYDSWLESEHKGMRMQMSRKAFIARIAELACADGEWMRDKTASGDVLKTNCEKWCPDLRVYKKAQRFDDTSGYIGFGGRQRGFYRTKVFEYCRAHSTTPADLGSGYEAVRASLGIVNRNDD